MVGLVVIEAAAAVVVVVIVHMLDSLDMKSKQPLSLYAGIPNGIK
jgi:hypothetical protein